MADPRLDELLERHRPVLHYDSHEVYFADSAAIWTDCPGQALRRYPQGTLLAQTPPGDGLPALELAFLAPGHYADGTAVEHEDLIACPTRNYGELARRMHATPGYADRMYGRSAQATDGRTWLQYWFFYFYNDFELLGSAFPAGLHEGDWEMIGLRLDAAGEAPELALYSQHKGAGASRWEQVEKAAQTRPVIYVARGSHAGYFSAGHHWQGHWWDHADGRGGSPELGLEVAHEQDPRYAWLRWPGVWGDTKPNPDELFRLFDDSSPRGPGGHRWWNDPHKLLETVDDWRRYEVHAPQVAEPAAPAPRLPHPAAPSVELARGTDGDLEISYQAAGWPAGVVPVQLIATINPEDDLAPPFAWRVPVDAERGAVEAPAKLDRAMPYEVTVSLAGRSGGPGPAEAPPLTSASTTEELPAA